MDSFYRFQSLAKIDSFYYLTLSADTPVNDSSTKNTAIIIFESSPLESPRMFFYPDIIQKAVTFSNSKSIFISLIRGYGSTNGLRLIEFDRKISSLGDFPRPDFDHIYMPTKERMTSPVDHEYIELIPSLLDNDQVVLTVYS